MIPGRPRCTRIASTLGEPMYGTASTVRTWILLEQPGPWGYDAVLQSHLAPRTARALRNLAGKVGARPVLLRRPGRHRGRGHHCYLVCSGPGTPWMEHAVLDRPSDILTWDLAPMAHGRPPGMGVLQDAPLHLVCTNGRRDPCCAERGRPLSLALSDRFGDRVFECSHIGGDRFAGNLVCLPHGLYFGRVGPRVGVKVAARYERGLIDLARYRGRSCYGFAAQAAEYFLRRREDLRGVEDLRLIGFESTGDAEVTAAFDGPAGRMAVRVRVGSAEEPSPLTCHGHEELHPRTFEVVEGRVEDRIAG